MSKSQEVIAQTFEAANYVAETSGPVDTLTAELVLRNTAVVADRLSPRQFSKLGQPAINALFDVAAAARELAPIAEEDQQKLSTETVAEHIFRTQVWHPIHSLQSAVSIEKFDKNDLAVVEKVKKAVWLGSVAFDKVLSDPRASEFTSLQQTVDYFGGNSRAAAGRAKRSKTGDL